MYIKDKFINLDQTSLYEYVNDITLLAIPVWSPYIFNIGILGQILIPLAFGVSYSQY